MGLGMYVHTTTAKPATEVDFETGDHTELHYWRKHPNLHGLMRRLYQGKGGKDPEFNCAKVMLTEADLDQLKAAIRDYALPHTEGFFFGISDGTELPDDLAFVTKARQALVSGLTVYYTSWW